MKRQGIFLFVMLFLLPLSVGAQEMNAKVVINTDKITGTNKQIYTTLQKALTEFINNKKWTDATFSINERIQCTFTITINEKTADDSFSGEIQVVARRPVYNSTYTTTLFNYRDKDLDFQYTEYEPFEYTQNTLENNLTATIVYYVYTLLGLDFDSFSSLSGTPYYAQATQIVTLAQSQPSWNGWKAFEDEHNRQALNTALTDNNAERYRKFWYSYHLKGLDEMAGNPDRGRTNIIADLATLQEVKEARPSTLLLQLFSSSKLDEVIAIYSEASSSEKQEGYKMLSEIYPSETMRLEKIKKNK